MTRAFSSTTSGLLSFLRSSQASQKRMFSSLYSHLRNSRKTARPMGLFISRSNESPQQRISSMLGLFWCSHCFPNQFPAIYHHERNKNSLLRRRGFDWTRKDETTWSNERQNQTHVTSGSLLHESRLVRSLDLLNSSSWFLDDKLHIKKKQEIREKILLDAMKTKKWQPINKLRHVV